MDRQKLAQKLVESGAEKRKHLLEKYLKFCDAELAGSLQQICYEIWTSQPQRVSVIVRSLNEMVALTGNKEIRAYADWTKAIENLVNGKLEDCLSSLDKSENLFKRLGKIHTAATTQISKLYALGLLGRYDEAVACGLRARDVFVAHEDIYSAGKIENNIGNLYWRRDLYRESEPFLDSAHARFTAIDDQRQIAMVENCQAFVKALQNNFREAETIYRRALKRAETNNLTVTEAEIETGMSNLNLFQGRFDRALQFMEKSRRKYDVLEMPHQSAASELEIADIYLELNLLPEALGFYEKAEAKFTEFGMRAELARSFLNHAKALSLLGETDIAKEFLDKSENLFAVEGNRVSSASVKLAKAQIFFGESDLCAAETEAEHALQTFKESGNLRQELAARWLLGEICLMCGEKEKARRIFRQTLKLSAHQSRQIEYLCLVSLGRVSNDEKFFLKAVKLVENSRASLAAEEFRTAFLSDKLLPYNELVKIKLAAGNFTEAFAWHERARSRTLLETMNLASANSPPDKELAALREELNWYYSRINRQTASGLEARKEVASLRKLAEQREKNFAEMTRRLQMNKNAGVRTVRDFNLNLQHSLSETTLVEFAIFDGKISAFLLTDKDLQVFRAFADEEEINAEIRQFLFQIKTARIQNGLSAENRRLAFERMLHHSQKIYNTLLRPLEKHFDRRRITLVAANVLHYLPFQALHDGEKFLIERYEISYAPSAAVLQNCLRKKAGAPKSALLVGVADKITPLVKTEIEMLGELFADSVRLIDKQATLKNLHKNIESADVLHLACHSRFRPDNPAFSSLALFCENLMVGDAQKMELTNKLVTLSACETGLNKIVSGEELIGLTRGFLAAGASSLLLSLWTVNDRSTLDLMRNFYREIVGGNNYSKALQIAQIQMLRENLHPYFWAPFGLIGHW